MTYCLMLPRAGVGRHHARYSPSLQFLSLKRVPTASMLGRDLIPDITVEKVEILTHFGRSAKKVSIRPQLG